MDCTKAAIGAGLHWAAMAGQNGDAFFYERIAHPHAGLPFRYTPIARAKLSDEIEEHDFG